MKRSEATAQFGRHYVVNAMDRKIYEQIGHGYGDDPITDLDDARAKLTREVKQIAQGQIELINRRLSLPANKILTWRAKWGLHKNAATILKTIGEWTEKRATHQATIDSDHIDAEIVQPKDDLKIPNILPVGQKIFIIDTAYINETGIRQSEATIMSRNIHAGSAARGDWDYVVNYVAGGENVERFSFEHNTNDAQDLEVKNNYYGRKYFLTRDAADDYILQLGEKLSAQFKQAAGEIAARRNDNAQKPKGPDLNP